MLLVSCHCDRSQNLIPLGPQWAAGHGPALCPGGRDSRAGERVAWRGCAVPILGGLQDLSE